MKLYQIRRRWRVFWANWGSSNYFRHVDRTFRQMAIQARKDTEMKTRKSQTLF